MQADKTTLNDLSIFHHDEEQSVFLHLNLTTTIGGREYLRQMLASPFSDLSKIQETQQILQLIIKKHSQWPTVISNGTVMVIEKYFETAQDALPRDPNQLSAFAYSVMSAPDFSLTKYSIRHFLDFCRGIQAILQLFDGEELPPMLQTVTKRLQMLVNKPVIEHMTRPAAFDKPTKADILKTAYFLRHHYKPETLELINIFSRLDAWYGMATACIKHKFSFPEIEKRDAPYINAKGLYHLLLPSPVAYDITLDNSQNFLFLTGANMAGKSTFIKAVGISVYLAHVGMGVPAEKLQISMFDGLLSNIQVEDNIMRGESYFFNEVKRVKKTIEKINDVHNWLIIIDELFKGTNVQDAMKCSTIVIEGLRKLKNALFILSTHLYEIGDDLKQYPNIKFSYFETSIQEGQLVFSYQLKDGVSNDRLGYLILKREGVVKMLEDL
jgi:DNA mismatch repair ATPase MutS